MTPLGAALREKYSTPAAALDALGLNPSLIRATKTGNDVVVGDSKLETTMSKNGLSLKGAVAKGALSVYLRPKLAQDAKIDLAYLLKGVTASNWKTAKPKLAADIKAKARLAKDADLEDLVELLDSLDGEEPVAAIDEEAPVPVPVPNDKEAKEGEDDEHSETDEEAVWRQLYEALGKFLNAKPPAAMDEDEPPASPKPENALEKEGKTVDKGAMDAAIAKVAKDTEARTIERMNAIYEAKLVVKPLVGEIVVAMDSAEAVYQSALKSLGIPATGINLAGMKAVVDREIKHKSESGRATTTRIAQDAAGATEFAQAEKTLGVTIKRARHI